MTCSPTLRHSLYLFEASIYHESGVWLCLVRACSSGDGHNEAVQLLYPCFHPSHTTAKARCVTLLLGAWKHWISCPPWKSPPQPCSQNRTSTTSLLHINQLKSRYLICPGLAGAGSQVAHGRTSQIRQAQASPVQTRPVPSPSPGDGVTGKEASLKRVSFELTREVRLQFWELVSPQGRGPYASYQCATPAMHVNLSTEPLIRLNYRCQCTV